ncbi:MAG: hypothetical protein R2824_27380 [Saprospiraceae bacterium]|nr:hypothetical protein [Lewinella sp.]
MEEKILDQFENEDGDQLKARHGCVTAWLILVIVVNAITVFTYLFFSSAIADALPGQPSTIMLMAMGLVGILNIIFAVMLFQWKKVGFYGFIGTSVLAFILNIMMGLGMMQSISGLIGIGILYAILQINAKNGRTAWDSLE